MSYTIQTWTTGDTITAEKLNHVEEGIFDAGRISVDYFFTADTSVEIDDTCTLVPEEWFYFDDIGQLLASDANPSIDLEIENYPTTITLTKNEDTGDDLVDFTNGNVRLWYDTESGNIHLWCDGGIYQDILENGVTARCHNSLDNEFDSKLDYKESARLYSQYGTFASSYDEESTYSVGDYVNYNGGIHKCAVPVNEPEEFDYEKWETVIVMDEIKAPKFFDKDAVVVDITSFTDLLGQITYSTSEEYDDVATALTAGKSVWFRIVKSPNANSESDYYIGPAGYTVDEMLPQVVKIKAVAAIPITWVDTGVTKEGVNFIAVVWAKGIFDAGDTFTLEEERIALTGNASTDATISTTMIDTTVTHFVNLNNGNTQFVYGQTVAYDGHVATIKYDNVSDWIAEFNIINTTDGTLDHCVFSIPQVSSGQLSTTATLTKTSYMLTPAT